MLSAVHKTRLSRKFGILALALVLSATAFFALSFAAQAVGTVTLSQTGSSVDADGAGQLWTTVTYTATYSGPADPPFFSLNYDCGPGKVGAASPPTSSTRGPNTFTCTFAPGSNSIVTAVAYGTTANELTRASVPVGVSDTGSASEVENQYRTIVFSFLAPIFLAIQSFLFFVYWIIILPIILAVAQIQTGVGSCATAEGTGFLTGICGAWEIVRNFVNLLFILLMIIIGAATILRLQSYNYKRLLGKLIIMALLVNFSLVIALAFLKLFDILRFTFLDPDDASQITRLGYKLIGFHIVSVGGTDALRAIAAFFLAEFTGIGQVPVLGAELLNLALSFLAFVVMGALAVYMMIAVVALRILVILSPFWPAFSILPATAGLAKAWWTNFFKYGVFIAIIFFFLRIAIQLMDQPFFGQIKNGCEVLNGPSGPACPESMGLFTEFIFEALQKIGVVAFVFAALMVAKKLSIFGANAITGLGQKAMMLPLVGAGAVGGFALGAGAAKFGRDWNEYTTKKILGHKRDITPGKAALFAAANPVAFFKGMRMRSHALSEARSQKAVAGGLQAAEQIFTSGRVSKDRMYDAEVQEEQKALKDRGFLNRDQQVEEGGRAIRLGNSEEERAIKRADTIANPMKEGFLDDQVTDASILDSNHPENFGGIVKTMTPFLQKMKNEIKVQMVAAGLSEAEADRQAEDFMFYTDKKGDKRIKYDPNMGTTTAFYRAMHGDDQAAWRRIAELGETEGKRTNHAEYLAISGKHSDGTYGQAGNFVVENGQAKWQNDKGALFAAREWAKLPSRIQAALAWHAIRGIGTDGEINAKLWDATSNALAENPTFGQQRTSSKLLTDDQDYMVSDAGKNLVNTGVMKIDNASFKAVLAMFNHSPVGAQAVAGMYNRMLGLDMNRGRDGGLTKTLRDGIKLQAENGQVVTLRDAKIAAELAEQENPAGATTLEAVKEGQIENSERKDDLKARLDSANQSGPIPQFNELIDAVRDLSKNQTAAQNIAKTNIEKLAQKKTEQMDFAKELDATVSPRAVKMLAPQELTKLVEAVAKGAKQGLINSSRHPVSDSSDRKMDLLESITLAIKGAGIEDFKTTEDLQVNVNIGGLVDSIQSQADRA